MTAQTTDTTAALTRIIDLSDVQRFSRACDRDAVAVGWVNGGFSATVTGGEHAYDVRIQVEGTRNFRCSCPDHHFRSTKSRKPCKHVVTVACEVLDQMEQEARQGA